MAKKGGDGLFEWPTEKHGGTSVLPAIHRGSGPGNDAGSLLQYLK
jgi:hypothetical protein